MSDGDGAQGGGSEGEGGAGGTGGEGVAAREWMAGLPEDLRGNETLARYETPEAQLRGHLEARRIASSRVAVPGKDADQGTRDAFFKAIGRPDTADGYGFQAGEGQDEEGLKTFAAKAFEIGMPKDMADAVIAFDRERDSARAEAWKAGAEKELADWKAANTDHAAKLAQMQGLFKRFGGDELTAAEIESRLGTGKMLDLFAKMAAATTEAPRHDGDTARQPGDAPNADDVEKRWETRMADTAWRAKVSAGDADATREYNELVQARREAMAAKRVAKSG